jgi:hypothetical protein
MTRRLWALREAVDSLNDAAAQLAPYYPDLVHECEILSARIAAAITQARRSS